MDTKELLSSKIWEQVSTDRLTVDRNDYTIKTAGSYLYEFIGKNLYYTFIQLVDENDREGVKQILAEGNEGKSFLARLTSADNVAEWFVLRIEKVMNDRVIIKMTNISSVLSFSAVTRERNAWLMNLLDLWDYLYFFYDKAEDKFWIIRIRKEGIFNLYEGSLSDWIDGGLKAGRFPKSQKKVLLNFKESVENQVNYLEYNFSTNYFSQSKEMQSFCVKATVSPVKGKAMVTGLFAAADGSHIELDGFDVSYTRDALTGLFNKKDIEIIVRQCMKYHPDQEIALAILDLDDFKQVNDSRGHMFGDEVLLRATEVMKSAVGDKGYVGRIGGDEFMLVLTGANSEDEQRNVLRSVKNGIMQMYTMNEDGFVQTCSIGCARTPLNTKDYRQLFKLADYALYLAKEKGKCRYIIYKPEQHGYPEFNDGDNVVTIKPKNTVAMATFASNLLLSVQKGQTELHELLIRTRAYLEVDRIVIYDSNRKVVDKVSSESAIQYENMVVSADYLAYDEIRALIAEEGVLRFSNAKAVEAKSKEAYALLQKQHLQALIQLKIYSIDESTFWYVSFEFVEQHTWRDADKDNFRLIAKILLSKLQ